jgi:hypothetical protein
MLDKSDYETNSEYNPDFDSDIEPPQDKLQEKKLYHKSTNLRLYKRIIKLPKRSLELPAKFDRVNVKFLEVPTEDLDPQKIADEQIKEWQLGISDLNEAIEHAICSMKVGEISIFEVEEVYIDGNTRDRKLGNRWYFMAELINFVTIIDVFADHKIYKIVETKGSGISRLEASDRIKLEFTLKNCNNNTVAHESFEDSFKDVTFVSDFIYKNLISKNVSIQNDKILSIIQTFKAGEKAVIEIPAHDSDSKIRQASGSSLTINGIDYLLIQDHFYVEINVKLMLHHEDVFNDKQIIKTLLKQGYTTAKPEDFSRLYFDYSIFIDDSQVFSSNFISREKCL